MDIQKCQAELLARPRNWLITGVAGFVGSNLLERLLTLNQKVSGLDNLSTGYRHNLESVRALVTPEQWSSFRFIEGDIRNLPICRSAVEGVDYVLHQAAMGSVPRSMLDPISTHENNVNGFLNILVAARDARVRRLVYASSSSVYGDQPDLPKVEENTGNPLSPYAATKQINELYAGVFARCYAMQLIGLRYFNIFGPRQDPDGAYAAVIPLWFKALLKHEPLYIYGDGETSRDFCYVENAIQANLLAAMTSEPSATGKSYNIAVGERTTLSGLFNLIHDEVLQFAPDIKDRVPEFKEFRHGDIRHSLADITKAKRYIGYAPTHTVRDGLKLAASYYVGLFTNAGYSVHS
ncbi:MAG: SDR family oxidoreductase [Gammaproteobacteria bacterium]|nr:SDR family oxidoreductase [Gammaproteobacteria bacterium]